MTSMLPVPMAYNSAEWSQQSCDNPPRFYRGTKFDFSIVTELIQADTKASTVTIMGKTIKVVNLQAEAPELDPNYPIYFEVTGDTYHYVFSFWSDRAVIEIKNRLSYETLSVDFPSTEEQLARALTDYLVDL